MKKSNIILNHRDHTITVSKSFYKRASVYGSAEYRELRNAMMENPSYSIEFKTIEKKTYRELTFKVMKDYIETQPDSDKMLAKFAAVQRVAKAKGGLYPLTKKWFLNAYPDYKENEVSEAETKELTADELDAEAEAEVAAIISSANSDKTAA